MKLDKKVITILIIILLVVDLIFLSFLLVSRKITSNGFIEKQVYSFDLKKYLLDDSDIKNSIDNYKYPKEVFDYIDNDKIDDIKNNFKNKLFAKEKILVEEKQIVDLLISSVNKYEIKTYNTVYQYVNDDINTFATKIANTFNNSYTEVYSFFYGISNGFLLIVALVLGILFTVLLILNDKKKGYLYASIIYLTLSFILYYFNYNYINTNNYDMLKYINIKDLSLDFEYIICFILGFVLLLIYIGERIKEMLRENRIKGYSNSWR